MYTLNEQARRLNEKILNLFSKAETKIREGWVLQRIEESKILINPLYGRMDEPKDNIIACEKWCEKNGQMAIYRLLEHENYLLNSRLDDLGYGCKYHGTVRFMDLKQLEDLDLAKKKPGLEIYILNSSDTERNVYGLTFDIFKFALNDLSGNAITIKENDRLNVIALDSGDYLLVQHRDQMQKEVYETLIHYAKNNKREGILVTELGDKNTTLLDELGFNESFSYIYRIKQDTKNT